MTDEKYNPLSEALRAQIVDIVLKGDDKSGGKLTPEVLSQVARVAKTGRELLVSLDTSNLANMVRRPAQSQFGIGLPVYQAGISGSELGDDQMSSPNIGIGAYAPASPVENFGMTALREIIAVARNFNGMGKEETPAKLVEALVIAKENGLHDVVRELERKLGVERPAPPKLETIISVGDGVTKTTVQEEKS